MKWAICDIGAVFIFCYAHMHICRRTYYTTLLLCEGLSFQWISQRCTLYIYIYICTSVDIDIYSYIYIYSVDSHMNTLSLIIPGINRTAGGNTPRENKITKWARITKIFLHICKPEHILFLNTFKYTALRCFYSLFQI